MMNKPQVSSQCGKITFNVVEKSISVHLTKKIIWFTSFTSIGHIVASRILGYVCPPSFCKMVNLIVFLLL